MKRVQVVRILVIDGQVEWVKHTMALNAVKGLNTAFELSSDKAVYERSVRYQEYETPDETSEQTRKEVIQPARKPVDLNGE